MKDKYAEQEQKEIAAWCDEAIKLYVENIDRHGQEPGIAHAKTMIEIREALATEIERIPR